MYTQKAKLGQAFIVSCSLIALCGGQALADTLSGGMSRASTEATSNSSTQTGANLDVGPTPTPPPRQSASAFKRNGSGPSNPTKTRRQMQRLIRDAENPLSRNTRAGSGGRLQGLIKDMDSPHPRRVVRTRKQLAYKGVAKSKKTSTRWKQVDYDWNKKTKKSSYVHMNTPK